MWPAAFLPPGRAGRARDALADHGMARRARPYRRQHGLCRDRRERQYGPLQPDAFATRSPGRRGRGVDPRQVRSSRQSRTAHRVHQGQDPPRRSRAAVRAGPGVRRDPGRRRGERDAHRRLRVRLPGERSAHSRRSLRRAGAGPSHAGQGAMGGRRPAARFRGGRARGAGDDRRTGADARRRQLLPPGRRAHPHRLRSRAVPRRAPAPRRSPRIAAPDHHRLHGGPQHHAGAGRVGAGRPAPAASSSR